LKTPTPLPLGTPLFETHALSHNILPLHPIESLWHCAKN